MSDERRMISQGRQVHLYRESCNSVGCRPYDGDMELYEHAPTVEQPTQLTTEIDDDD